jgi:hypothetical protein
MVDIVQRGEQVDIVQRGEQVGIVQRGEHKVGGQGGGKPRPYISVSETRTSRSYASPFL